jgi:hypothetical protein
VNPVKIFFYCYPERRKLKRIGVRSQLQEILFCRETGVADTSAANTRAGPFICYSPCRRAGIDLQVRLRAASRTVRFFYKKLV